MAKTRALGIPAEKAIDLRNSNAPWREIGALSGITGQRAQQLYSDLVGYTPEEITNLRAEIVKYLEEYGPLTRDFVVNHFKLPSKRSLRAFEISAFYFLPDTPKKNNRTRFSDAFMVKCLKRAAEDLGVEELSAMAYMQWRDSLGTSSNTVLSVPGINLRYSWREACAMAGLKSGRPRRTGYPRMWTVEDVLRWVSTYVEWCMARDMTTTYANYDIWQRNYSGAPCGSMIRRIAKKPWRGIVEESAGYASYDVKEAS
jgi:hypothetical protein